MAICVYCAAEVLPGDKVTEVVEGQWRDFCSREHLLAYQQREAAPPAAKTPEPKSGSEEKSGPPPFETLTRQELMRAARAAGIDFDGHVTKNELITALHHLSAQE
jgi:hypothetical protein